MSFDGLRVLSLESRRAKEIEGFIQRLGGDAFVAPSVAERPVENVGVAAAIMGQLESGAFDLLICMTGTGLAFLKDLVEVDMPVERLAAALRTLTIVSRGPKPVPLLRSLNVPVAVVVPEPNTWREIVTAVAERHERRIAVQEYGRPNFQMNAALEALGASVTPLVLYRWTLPDDIEPLREAARRLAARQVDSMIFTSSIQLDHLLEIARELQIEERVYAALRNEVAVASVGPVMTESLEAHGIPADIVPKHPKMASLVKAASEETADVLQRKRTARVS
ncbi:MAG: uroporphyrinogen-III synthase [Acidobacteriota bacterium]